jgi:antitoxin PrlF
MATTPELESTLTDRYQTTVPDGVRRALKLGKRDKIRYRVQPDGAVLMTRASPGDEDDPVLGEFLRFIEHDITTHPRHVRAVGEKLRSKIQALVGRMKVDLDQPLDPEDV